MAAVLMAARRKRAWWPQPGPLLAALRARRGTRAGAAAAGMGVDGLPHGVGHMPTGAVAALLTHAPAHELVWTPALLLDWLDAGPVLVLGTESAALDALLGVPALQAAYASGRLRAWLLPARAQGRLRHEGLAGFAREVRRAGASADSAVCVLDANALVAGASVAQLRRLSGQLRRWGRRLRGPAALMFPVHRMDGPEGAAGADPMAAARLVVGTFDHVAELSVVSEGPVLTLHRWDGEHSAVLHASYGLRLLRDSGDPAAPPRLHYGGSLLQGAIPRLVQAPDAADVLATLSSLRGQSRVPPAWNVLPGLQALEQAAQRSIGATVLLDAGGEDGFAAVAALVHRLRSARPRSLKIIVRDTRGDLRAHMEQALLRLGATAVVYREVGFARLLRIVEEHQSLVHTRPVETDCAATIQACAAPPARGYLAPRAFALQLRETLARTRLVALEHCLVYLQLHPRVPHLDALRAARPARDGDLLSADAHGIYVFLFACTQADLDEVLQRLFNLPLEQCFYAQKVDASESDIQATLERLYAAAPGLPDFSAMALAVAAEPGPVAASPADGGGASPPPGDGSAALPVRMYWSAAALQQAAPAQTGDALAGPDTARPLLRARPIGRVQPPRAVPDAGGTSP